MDINKVSFYLSKIIAVLLIVLTTYSNCLAKNIKAIYIGTKHDIQSIVTLLEKFKANAVIIDIKNDRGEITCNLEIDKQKIYIPNIKQLIMNLKKRGIYTIARIVAFKDSIKTDLCILTKDNKPWIDKEKTIWLNPYNKKTWEYITEISKKSVKIGFDEIQYDYIRFSSYLNKDDAVVLDTMGSRASRCDIINQFLKYSIDEIHKLGAVLSIDVFGCIIENTTKSTAAENSEILGQDYIEISKIVDYICPMVYPSHYPNGSMRIDCPDLEPYETIYRTMQESNKMLNGVKNKHAIVRPFLQAFTAKWLKKHQKYTMKQINEQIKATEDAGIKEWALFDFSVRYNN